MIIKERLLRIAELMPEKPTPVTLLSLKLALLLMLDEVDRAMDYGHPGRAIDNMLGTNVIPINARKEAAE